MGARLHLRVRTPRWEDDVELQLTGSFNAYNALAAIGVGEALGLDPAAMRARPRGAVAACAGGCSASMMGQPFTVFVDFAHTPGALEAALDSLAPHAAARGGGLISPCSAHPARATRSSGR